ncbi:ciliary microtubule inner protein 2B isoform X1 [Microcebus murinus]|uniref:ciliary microtubule inner protein 2B isoform X1 n=1 Tax=Microcebus murinus TaxID=30608 RepID=UPI003F6AA757
MGQTYGQVTGQLLRGPPGLAWPPAHRTLLPPIRPPRSPEVPKGSLRLRRGHERLSSCMIPGYTGFIPRAQFIFAKNCSQVWAEALNDFTQLHGGQGSQELPKEAKGEKDLENDQESKPELELELELEKEAPLEEADQVFPYSMDDGNPQKFFMSGENRWVMTKGLGRPRDVLAQCPHPPQASLAMCPVPASSSAPAFLCSPTRRCGNLGIKTHRVEPRRIPNTSPHFPGSTRRSWGSYLTTGAMCQGISSSLATHLGISPMILWASALSRSSSWLRLLEFKFFFPSSSYPSHPSGRMGEHKKKMVWRLSTFFINRYNK